MDNHEEEFNRISDDIEQGIAWLAERQAAETAVVVAAQCVVGEWERSDVELTDTQVDLIAAVTKMRLGLA